MEEKTTLLDELAIDRTLARISHEIIEHHKKLSNVVLVGILTRGYPLAKRIQQNIEQFVNERLEVGKLDITFYRDDLSKLGDMPILNNPVLDFDVEEKDVILVDDVIFTGRTARAAIEAILKKGRPKTIQLACLIDRGHRELPIKPDYVGKNIPTSLDEIIKVSLVESDGVNKVGLYRR